MRIVLVRPALLTALVVLIALVGATPGASTSPPIGSSFYVLRPDPRLCPSPLCGGYWVSLANHPRTRCHDGLLRPLCYVARIVDKDHHPPADEVPADGLARAMIEPWKYEGIGELGVLVVADAFAPAGRAPASGRFLRLVDTGIRCVRAPCFSVRASRLNRPSQTTLSDLDLAAADASPAELARAEAALQTKNGLLAQGSVAVSSDGGRVLRATRLFLRSRD